MAFRRLPFLVPLLLFVDFLDEFSAGMPTVGVAGIQEAYELRYASAALLIFTAPLCVAWLLEPPLFVLADRHPKKYFVCGGLLAMGALDLVVGLSGEFLVVAFALLLSATASGCGVSLSQAALMDAHPQDRERLMTRWAFLGATGDLAAPVLFWGLALLALGWREAFLTTGVVLTAYAALLWFQRFPEPAASGAAGERDGPPGTLEALRLALKSRRLLLWLAGAWLCSLLDEILVAFGVLRMRDLGADTETRSAILVCLVLGGMLGLALLDRVVSRADPLRLLRGAGLAGAVAYAGWLFATTPVAIAAWMFATGFFNFALYPLAKAQAYAALPGRAGMVNAVAHLFTPLDVVLPLVLGLLADRFGLLVALAVLLAQPLGLFAIALSQSRAVRPA